MCTEKSINWQIFFTNHIFFFLGIDRITPLITQELPREEKKILTMDKQHIQNVRIKKLQNKNFDNKGR